MDSLQFPTYEARQWSQSDRGTHSQKHIKLRQRDRRTPTCAVGAERIQAPRPSQGCHANQKRTLASSHEWAAGPQHGHEARRGNRDTAHSGDKMKVIPGWARAAWVKASQQLEYAQHSQGMIQHSQDLSPKYAKNTEFAHIGRSRSANNVCDMKKN